MCSIRIDTLVIIILFVFKVNISLSQNKNSSSGFYTVKVNISNFNQNSQKRLSNGNPNKNTSRANTGPSIIYDQIKKKYYVFPGLEINYSFERHSFFGVNIGFAYSFDKTYYNVSYGYRTHDGLTDYKLTIGTGNASLNNHMFKFIYGFNFNTKFKLNIYIHLLNPEIRFYNTGKSNIVFDVYDGYYYKVPQPPNYFKDSLLILNSSETKHLEFVNYKTSLPFSIAFPTLIGIEQKFKIGKLNYVAGASVAASILEQYLIYRAHIGVCLFKRSKPVVQTQ